MGPNPHELLDQAMEDRRLELGMTWKQVSTLSGVTVETLSALRKGRTNPHNASPLTRRGIERALRWATGGYDNALAGRKPTPLAVEVAHPEHAPPALPHPLDELEEWRQRTIIEMVAQLPPERRAPALHRLAERVAAGELPPAGPEEEPAPPQHPRRTG